MDEVVDLLVGLGFLEAILKDTDNGNAIVFKGRKELLAVLILVDL